MLPQNNLFYPDSYRVLGLGEFLEEEGILGSFSKDVLLWETVKKVPRFEDISWLKWEWLTKTSKKRTYISGIKINVLTKFTSSEPHGGSSRDLSTEFELWQDFSFLKNGEGVHSGF